MARLASAFVLSLTLFTATASAQIGQGTLTGVVTDPQGQVLPGVTVTATSTALIGTRSAVTEVDGRYRFPALPSGIYKLKFDLSGFSSLERDNIQVVLGQTIAVDTQLKIASLAETVTVQAESPVVDVTTTKVGTSLKGDELTAIPNSTDVWGALSESPGVRMRGFDVGGSHKSQQSSYEVFGVQNQARVVTEGIDFGFDTRPCHEAAEVEFAHKTGLTYNAGGDAGIVRALPGEDGRRYIVAVLSNVGYRFGDPDWASSDPNACEGAPYVCYPRGFGRIGAAVDELVATRPDSVN